MKDFESRIPEAIRIIRETGDSLYVLQGRKGILGKTEPYVCVVAKTENPQNRTYQLVIDGKVEKEYNLGE